MDKETIKRYLISTGVTFVAGFAIAVAPKLDDSLTIEAVKNGALFGIIFSGARLGIKMVLEGFLAIYAKLG